MTSLSHHRFAAVKAKLHGGCAAITCALMLGLGAPASAQVSGNLVWDSGGVTIDTTGGRTNVQVRQTETLINWRPTGPTVEGATVFLPAGASLNYEGAGEQARYVVLNQFVNGEGGALGSSVAFLGNVTSDANVDLWFQNSGGILVGANATFNVGSLLLTTATPTLDGVIGLEELGEDNFRQRILIETAAGINPNAAVDIRGRITVNSGGLTDSYFAVVAPRIRMTGTANVAGSAAYVAAEAANITIRENLFDIEVTSGSTVAEALDHSGSTILATNAYDQNIYMVAMPKSSAVSMLVGGNLGYSADSASVASDGAIILSAGRNIIGGDIDMTGDPAANADIRLVANSGTSNFNGRVNAAASRNITGTVASGSTLNLANDTDLHAVNSVSLTINGRLAMNQGQLPSETLPGEMPAFLSLTAKSADGVGGTAEILVAGGTLQLGRDLSIDTSISNDELPNNVSGGISRLEVTGGGRVLGHADGTSNIRMEANGNGRDGGAHRGGQVLLRADGGTVSLLRTSVADPDAPLFSDLGRITLSADGRLAGRIEVRAANNGVIEANGLSANAYASGDSDAPLPPPNGSLTASDGIIFVANNGRLTMSDSLSAYSAGNIGFHISNAGNNAISAGKSIEVNSAGSIELRHTGRAANANSLQASRFNWSAGTSITSDASSKINITPVAEGEYYVEDSLFSAGGNIDLGLLQSANDTRFETEQGTLQIDNYSGDGPLWALAQMIDIASDTDLSLRYIESYTGNLSIRTTGVITAGGYLGAANDLILESSDLQGLGGEGSISDFNAGGRIRLINANPNNPMIIGGDGEFNYSADGDAPPSAYHLTIGELGSNFAGQNISFEAPASAANNNPQLIIRDTDFYMGDSGSVSFLSGGSIRVEGYVPITAEGNAVTVNFTAANTLHIVAGEGLINLMGTEAYGLRGTLNLTAPRIIAATQAAYDDLASARTIRQYEERLAQNDGFASDSFISADRINVQTDGGFFVQNVGDGTDADLRRGLVFGDGGVNITSTTGTPMVVINGYQAIYAGEEGYSSITGAAALAAVRINNAPAASANGFNRQSLMNGCLLANSSLCGADALTPEVTIIPEFPVQVVIKNPSDPAAQEDDEEDVMQEERESSEMPEGLINTSGLAPLSGQPLIIDPVTGTANDDMWGPTIP